LGVLFIAVPAAGAVPAAATASGTALRGVPALRWHGCNGGFYCTTLRVPLDYRDPDGRGIDIAVIEHRATDLRHRVGSLVFNPGGPGGAGTQALPLAYRLFPARLRARLDIVSFDPRGVGASTAVRCFPSSRAEERFFARLPAGFPVGTAQERIWERVYSRLARRCERTSAWLLPHLSTADVARDMDRLRQALGDRQLTYLGISYGTYLGASYANMFPGKVRAMVLDGNIDPVAWAAGDGRAASRSVSLRLHSDEGTAKMLNAFLDLCGRAGRGRCAFSAGSASATRAKFSALLRRLRRQPVSAGSPPVRYTYAMAVSTIDSSLGVPVAVPGLAPGWQAAAQLMQQLWMVSTGGPAGRAAAAPAQRPASATVSPGTAAAYPGREQQLAVICSDSLNPCAPMAYSAEAASAYARYGGPGPDWAWADEPCAAWPATALNRYTGPWNNPTSSRSCSSPIPTTPRFPTGTR
jgi:pimeloyl-ACP methyl ester carboxylesterase